MYRSGLAVCLSIFLVFAGCVGKSEPSAAPTTALTTAAPASVSADTGGIDGVVTDDEMRPIVAAEVALLDNANDRPTVKSDAEGKFSFSDLPPGTYQLAFSRLGYEGHAKKVEVLAGEVTAVTVILAAIEIVEIYPEMFIYKGFIKLGTALTAAAESDLDVVAGCEKCMNRFNTTKATKSVIFEALFKSTLPDPREMKLYTQTRADGKLLINSDWANRQKYQLDQGWTKGEFSQFVACGNVSFSVCYEQPFEIYTTLFQNGVAPDEYSGLPPL